MKRALALVLALELLLAGCSCPVKDDDYVALEAKLDQQEAATVPNPLLGSGGEKAVDDGWAAIRELVAAMRAAHARAKR